jgi:RND family efflux transporter MFP subunit
MLSRLFYPVLGLSLIVAAGGCGDASSPDASSGAASTAPATAASEASALQVEVLRLRPTSFEDVVDLTGTVEAVNDAVLSAQAAGTVTALVGRGTPLAAGRRVAQIDPREEQAAVDQARAQFDLASDRLARQEPLYRDSVISALEFEQVRAEHARARAALQEAEQRLEKLQVTAPFGGRVEARFVHLGEQVSPGTPVARVVDTRRVRVATGVPERYANDIALGTPVRLDVRRYGGAVQSVAVTFVGRTIDPDTRTFPIEIEVPNPDDRLKPEMVVRVSVPRARFDSVLVVPRSAVVRDETGTHAYVAVQTDSALVAQKRAVALGASYAERTVVTSGLASGDRVIVAGQDDVAPGDRVRIAAEQRLSPPSREGAERAARTAALPPTP